MVHSLDFMGWGGGGKWEVGGKKAEKLWSFNFLHRHTVCIVHPEQFSWSNSQQTG